MAARLAVNRQQRKCRHEQPAAGRPGNRGQREVVSVATHIARDQQLSGEAELCALSHVVELARDQTAAP